jgi:TolB-like protein
VEKETVDQQWSNEEVHQALSRILKSSTFSRANQLARFLKFAVGKTLEGNLEELKEHRIGLAVYDRQPSYSPSEESIVRTEASRLRKKLKEYYEKEGAEERVVISMHQGSYVASFSVQYKKTVAIALEDDRTETKGVSIAVLPFVDLSGLPFSSDCARGITEELIHALMNTDGFRVTSLAPINSQFANSVNAHQKPSVQVIIEGTVSLQENRLRVFSRVLDAEGFQLWSQRFEMKADQHSSFELQEQIATALVSRIRPQVSNVRKLSGTVSKLELATFPAILAGQALLDAGTTGSRATALAKFQELSKQVPISARAFCGLAQSYAEMAFRGEVPSTIATKEARQAADRANALDSEMLETYDTLAITHCLEWNWNTALATFQKAVTIDSHAPTFRDYAMLLTILGRFAEAEHYLQSAQKVDPFSNRQRVTSTRFYFFSRQFQKCIDYSESQQVYGGLTEEALLFDGLSRVRLDRLDEAKQIAVSAVRDSATQPFASSIVAEILFACGESTKALEILDNLNQAPGLSYTRKALLAIAQQQLDYSLEHLSQAFLRRESELMWLNVDPRFDQIRHEPGFKKMAEEIFARTDHS